MKNYNVKTISRAAMPRSKRLRDSGAQASSGGFISINGEDPVQPTPSGDGHTHSNLAVLDALDSIDEKNYLYIRQKQEGDSESSVEKVRSGAADETVSEDYEPGMLGSGHRVWTDPDTGESFAEVDHLSVRRSAHFYELVIQQLKHQSGIVITSAAGMECNEVEELSAGYKCYFDNKDGQLPNYFVVGDQAMCHRFETENLEEKYFWRLVTEVGDDYIVLSKTDCDTGSEEPEAGDVIIQLGNRTDTTRQAAKITRTIGDDSPRDEYYAGISSYNLTSKLISVVGVKDGVVGIYTNAGEFSGTVKAESGKIGAFTIDQLGLKNVTDSQNPTAVIIIERNGGNFIRLNSENDSMLSLRGDGKYALKATGFGDNSVALYAMAQAGSNTKALESYGNVFMGIRAGESAKIKYGQSDPCNIVTSNGAFKIQFVEDGVIYIKIQEA